MPRTWKVLGGISGFCGLSYLALETPQVREILVSSHIGNSMVIQYDSLKSNTVRYKQDVEASARQLQNDVKSTLDKGILLVDRTKDDVSRFIASTSDSISDTASSIQESAKSISTSLSASVNEAKMAIELAKERAMTVTHNVKESASTLLSNLEGKHLPEVVKPTEAPQVLANDNLPSLIGESATDPKNDHAASAEPEMAPKELPVHNQSTDSVQEIFKSSNVDPTSISDSVSEPENEAKEADIVLINPEVGIVEGQGRESVSHANQGEVIDEHIILVPSEKSEHSEIVTSDIQSMAVAHAAIDLSDTDKQTAGAPGFTTICQSTADAEDKEAQENDLISTPQKAISTLSLGPNDSNVIESAETVTESNMLLQAAHKDMEAFVANLPALSLDLPQSIVLGNFHNALQSLEKISTDESLDSEFREKVSKTHSYLASASMSRLHDFVVTWDDDPFFQQEFIRETFDLYNRIIQAVDAFTWIIQDLKKKAENDLNERDLMFQKLMAEERTMVKEAMEEQYDQKLNQVTQEFGHQLEEALEQQTHYFDNLMRTTIKERVSEERGRRLAKLDHMAAKLKYIQNMSNESSVRLARMQKIQVLLAHVKALERCIDEPNRQEMAKNIQKLKGLSEFDEFSRAISSTLVDDVGGEFMGKPQLVQQFYDLYPRVREVQFFPDQVGPIGYYFGKFMASLLIEKKGLVAGKDVDSVLSRAAYYMNHGNLEEATRELNQLEGWSGHILESWLDKSRRYLEIEQAVRLIETHLTLKSLNVID